MMWHSPQPAALKTGPRPSAAVSGPVNSSIADLEFAFVVRDRSGEFVDFGRQLTACALPQNSSAKPLDRRTKPAGASVARRRPERSAQ